MVAEKAIQWFKPGNKDTVKQAEKKDFAFVSQEVAYATSPSNWLADSAATIYIARNKADFATYTEEPSEIEGISPNEYYEHDVDLLMYNSVLVLQLNCDIKHEPYQAD